MKDLNDITKVEFLITLNNNFVVQRFFNVKGFSKSKMNDHTAQVCVR